MSSAPASSRTLARAPLAEPSATLRQSRPAADARPPQYTGVVTQLLEAALAQLAKLPPAEQDRVGRWLLEELRDEQLWDHQFRGSQDVLSKLAAEALSDLAAARRRSIPTVVMADGSASIASRTGA